MRFYRRAKLTRTFVAIAFVLCVICLRHEPSLKIAASLAWFALLGAYGLAVAIDQYRPFDRIARRIQIMKKGQPTWK